jgi:PAS domain S-box-containing protein
VLSGIAEVPARMEHVDIFISKTEGVAPLLDKIKELIRGDREMRLSTLTEDAIPKVSGKSDNWQQLLAAIVESSDDAIFSKTLDGIITSWNKAAEAMYGYRAEDIIGKPISILLPPDRPNEVDNILERLRRGEKVDHFETVRKCKDGRALTVSLTVSLIRDSTGRIIGAATISRDITHLKMGEQSMWNSERLAASGRMAATVAHEINNPLEAATNALYLLEKSLPSDISGRQFLTIAREELARIRQIATLTLGLHRGGDTERPQQVRVSELIDNVLSL